MDVSNVKVNETHMCVLRRIENGKKVKMDFIELKYAHQDLLKKLNAMAENDNRSVLELQDYVNATPLRLLKEPFDFCPYLSGSYQGVQDVKFISLADYQEKVGEVEKDGNKEELKNYKRSLRQAFYKEIASHVVPFLMEQQYHQLNRDKSIVAYSHRMVGWSFPSFDLNKDLKVVYRTNFGYGSSSYFYTQIYYKGIGILPYSDWVHYRNASTFDIIRYTRCHQLENNEWIKTMSFTAEVYNAAVSNPKAFVNDFIINEVEEMVSGVEDIADSAREYKIQYNNFCPGSYTLLTGDDYILFKGEKVSGALDFLDSLKTLIPITDKVSDYIKRIIQSNISILPQLQDALNNKNEIIEKYTKILEELQPVWDEYKERNDKYDESRSIIRKEIQADEANKDIGYYALCNLTDKTFKEKYPEYVEFKKEFEKQKTEYERNEKIKNREAYIARVLNSYIKKIESHQDYIEQEIGAA